MKGETVLCIVDGTSETLDFGSQVDEALARLAARLIPTAESVAGRD